ncbi:MAG: ArnT family glycosyltransferase [Verrucomicrobium sp.]
MISPWTARLALIVFWALIYLPGLGEPEIKGEEWRRTIPGRNMLQNGDWLVPRSGGLPYVRKPPLINWVSAVSFKVSGVVNEWSARLPSVLTILGATLGMFAFSRRFMGDRTAFIGGLFFLTSVGVIEKGRIAEIEVYYIAFTGLAFTAWLAGFTGKLNRWIAWLYAGAFLGLAMLAKGPMHLLFFYLPVIGACWSTRRWRELVSLPHLAGLTVFFAITLAWALPFISSYAQFMGIPKADVLGAWGNEVSSRVTGEEQSSTSDWLVRGPKALVMFLPWVLLLPLWWRRTALDSLFKDDPATRKTFDGLKWGVVAGFAFMVLIPSSSARYVAPLLAPVALMTAWIVSGAAITVTERQRSVWHLINRVFFGISIIALGVSAILYWPDSLAVVAAWTTGITLATWLTLKTVKGEGTKGVAALTVVSGLSAALLLAAFVRIGHSVMAQSEDIRPTANDIIKAMGPAPEGRLLVFHLGQIPYPFYFPDSALEVDGLEQVPQQEDIRWMLTSIKTDDGFRPWFERRFGPGETVAEFARTWGDQGKRGERMVLVKFAGRKQPAT